MGGILRTLSSGPKLRVLETLLGRELTPSKLARELGLSKQGVSKHLKDLEGDGLVQFRALGRSKAYRASAGVDALLCLIRRIVDLYGSGSLDLPKENDLAWAFSLARDCLKYMVLHSRIREEEYWKLAGKIEGLRQEVLRLLPSGGVGAERQVES